MKKSLYIVLFLVGLNATATFGNVSKIERQALIDLYYSTNGEQWTQKWDLSSPISNWPGVEVEDNSVVSVSLMNNNLSGQLPNSLGNLQNLRVLNLAFNSIKGTLPNTIIKLKSLMVLRLGKNTEKVDDIRSV